MVTERDSKALEFIQHFGMVTTKQVDRLVYNQFNVCNNRMKKLCDDKIIKRKKNVYGMGFIYYDRHKISMVQYKHYMVRNEMYLKMIDEGCVFEQIIVDRQLGSVRPDAVYKYKTKEDKSYFVFVEVELQITAADVGKYNRYLQGEYLEHCGSMPLVVYVTDKVIKGALYPHITINTKLTDICKIL